MTKIYFVTRHSGAVEWVKRKAYKDRQKIIHVHHIDADILDNLNEGDIVAGTLPIQLASEVCARGARYFHLSLNLPPGARGKELSADDMDRYGAVLEEFIVSTPLSKNERLFLFDVIS